MKKFLSAIEMADKPSHELDKSEPKPIIKESKLKKYIEKVNKEFDHAEKLVNEEKSKKCADLTERIKYRMYHTSGNTANMKKRLGQSLHMSKGLTKSASKAAKHYQKFINKESADAVDTVTLDIPLMIRLLEYAREDAKDDMDLHNVAEQLIKLGKSGTLTMDRYDEIVKDNPNKKSLD